MYVPLFSVHGLTHLFAFHSLSKSPLPHFPVCSSFFSMYHAFSVSAAIIPMQDFLMCPSIYCPYDRAMERMRVVTEKNFHTDTVS